MGPDKELDDVRRQLGLSVREVWISYFGLGGTAMPSEIAEYLDGAGILDATEHDVLAHAINELAMDRGWDHPAPYYSR